MFAKDYFATNYHTFTFEQFQQIVNVLKNNNLGGDNSEYLTKLTNSVLEEDHLKHDPFTLNAMLKVLN